MDFQTILDTVIQQATIWAPSITAVIGVIVATVSSSNKVKAGLEDMSSVANEIREQKAIKELTTELKGLRNDNRELKKQNRQILTQLSKIQKEEDRR